MLDALRWDLDLTGSKECCAEGECGACTVLVGGQAVNSCLVLAVEVDGLDITTIEGLQSGGRLSRLQDAFLETGADPVRLLHPGHGHGRAGTAEREPAPDARTRYGKGSSGNLCRCAGYQQIMAAVRVAAGPAAVDGAEEPTTAAELSA